MISTLMVSCDKKFFEDIESVLTENNIKPFWSGSGTNALSRLSEDSIDLVIIEENLPDMAGRQFIEKIVMKNPMINCVVASPSHKEEFHETYEGLGVLMQFSAVPGKKEAVKLLAYMKQVFNLQIK
jgi:DNA-binding response OmpR family regulator